MGTRKATNRYYQDGDKMRLCIKTELHKKSIYFDLSDYDILKKHHWTFVDKGVPGTRINGRCIKLTRIICGLENACRYKTLVVFLNDDNSDFTRKNLLVTDIAGRAIRNRKRRNCSSRFRGVSFWRETRRWHAQIRCPVTKKDLSLGNYSTELQAARRFNEEAVALYGDRARLNILPD